jgi:hypothetical protein
MIEYGHGRFLVECFAAFVSGILTTFGAIVASNAIERRRRKNKERGFPDAAPGDADDLPRR